MSERYDIVLYGASGFTGVYVLETLAKSAHQDVKFAVAGRSEQKLKKVLKEVSESTGHDLTDTPIIIADSSNENSLAEMAKKAKVIVNVVGPVSFAYVCIRMINLYVILVSTLW
uniref:Saccharopine dehydrogenase NADP binding domain-containing protein n=1 Tax=Panagrolaimus davidi TaxID=227884 RepID=A0A914QV62_9BILA